MIIDTVEISNLGLWENLFLKFDVTIQNHPYSKMKLG